MQTLIYIFILFIVVLLLIYIFFKSKQNHLFSLLSGSCPSCLETRKVFFDKNSNTKWILDLEDIVKDKLLFDQEVKNFTIKPVGGVGQFISRMWKFWVLYHSYCLQKTKIPLNIFIREVRQSHYNILDNKFLFEENIVLT